MCLSASSVPHPAAQKPGSLARLSPSSAHTASKKPDRAGPWPAEVLSVIKVRILNGPGR